MVIRGFKTEVNNKLLSISFPTEKNTVLFRGTRSLQVLHTVESLLSRDFTDYYVDVDKQYGYHYDEKQGVSQLMFDTGSIYGKEHVTSVDGKLPNIHCIRYLNNGIFRSFYITDNIKVTYIDACMTDYNTNVIPLTDWYRLFAMVNNLIGSEIVVFDGQHIRFNFNENSDWSVEAQKFVYLIIAECFITKDDFKRVLLMPDIDILYPTQQIRLLELLDNIKGHELTLSSGRIEFKDVTSNAVTSINV